jgi:hypothetical protein
MNLPTRALEYLKSVLAEGAKLIVLTGDAGHGKTHLCRRLLEEHLGYGEKEARLLINSSCDGKELIEPVDPTAGKIPLRIYKDFSEFEIEVAAKNVDEAILRTEEATIVCANEGRLRAVLESNPEGPGCSVLLKEFKQSFVDGLTSRSGVVHIVNLNYQSVAVGGEESLMGRALQEWLSGTRWRVCQECDSREFCPIFQNRNFLSPQSSSSAPSRRRRLEALFGTLERLGTVITIREMLMTIAYLVTGGLDCQTVHRMTSKKKSQLGWQHVYAYYNLLFQRPDEISNDTVSRIPVLLKLPQLDPGRRANRELDERLLNERPPSDREKIDVIFEYRTTEGAQLIDASNGIDDIVGYPKNRNDRRDEANFVRTVVRSLRRRSYFDDGSEGGVELDRLGFERGGDFLAIVKDSLSPAAMTRLKNHFVTGLHVVQGLQTKSNETNLHLVDPAFGKATVHAAIIAKKVPISRIKLLSQSQTWSQPADRRTRSMTAAVDWIERQIVFRVELDGEKFLDFGFDLMTFDCVSRAAGGFLAEEFYAHDIRRIKIFLARLAESGGNQDDDISLFMHGGLRSVSIDGDVIQVGGGA